MKDLEIMADLFDDYRQIQGEEVEKNMENTLDSPTSVWYNTRMNDEEKYVAQSDLIPCPSCSSEMEWHPNGHIASCTSCGHEEIL